MSDSQSYLSALANAFGQTNPLRSLSVSLAPASAPGGALQSNAFSSPLSLPASAPQQPPQMAPAAQMPPAAPQMATVSVGPPPGWDAHQKVMADIVGVYPSSGPLKTVNGIDVHEGGQPLQSWDSWFKGMGAPEWASRALPGNPAPVYTAPSGSQYHLAGTAPALPDVMGSLAASAGYGGPSSAPFVPGTSYHAAGPAQSWAQWMKQFTDQMR